MPGTVKEVPVTDSVRRLPLRPNLEQYKKQAKELVKTHGVSMSLADAQRAIALEHGFHSWARFRNAVLDASVSIAVTAGPFQGRVGTIVELLPHRSEVRVAVDVDGRNLELWLSDHHLSRL